MKILQISLNFLYLQRWAILTVMAYAMLVNVAVLSIGKAPVRADVMFLARQQAVLGVLFGITFAASALNNDLRSRRLLTILSKAVTRWEYLAATVCTCWALSLLYLGVTFATFAVGQSRTALSDSSIVLITGGLISLVSIAAVVCCSCLTHPLMATGLSVLLVFGPGLLIAGLGRAIISPAYDAAFAIAGSGTLRPTTVVLLFVHASFWMGLGAILFGRKDITAAVD